MRELQREWPQDTQLCFAACRNGEGRVTASLPQYMGAARFEGLLAERFVGEDLPIFRGPYIRKRFYVDLGTRKSCGALSCICAGRSGLDHEPGTARL